MLRQWSTVELLEIEDVRTIIRLVLSCQLCPDNGTVLQRRGGLHLGAAYEWNNAQRYQACTSSSLIDSLFHSSREDFLTQPGRGTSSPLRSTTNRELTMEGFGDEIDHYHFIETMLKLDPAQILHLYDHVEHKWQIDEYIMSLGEWFSNNGQTWSSTWELVLHQRGFVVQDVRERIEDGMLGVAVEEKMESLQGIAV